MRPPPVLPAREILCAEVFTLHKPNHARQDNLWLPLSNENSNAFLCRARLGSQPQTLDPLLTPGFLWAPASMREEEGPPPPTQPHSAHHCLHCWATSRKASNQPLGQPAETVPEEGTGPLPAGDPTGFGDGSHSPQEPCTPTLGRLPLHLRTVCYPKATGLAPQPLFLIHHLLDIIANT